ncbi:MAG TPA: hypothetical protein VH352_04265 [Pseudonocardiaceae bacterium]|jgi:hypothetical protein|nr:hypothetical protein [Pseudonocardiaceae bacterium]
MIRRLALLIGSGAVIVVVCTGCRGMAGQSPSVPPAGSVQTAPAGGGSGGTGDQLGSQLDDLQSSLNSVRAQLSTDAAP